MSGLSYICEYGESQSEDSDEEEKGQRLKRVKLPTPNLNGISVISNEDHVDNPSLHGGRIRVFPHVRGNWATFVYIVYPNKDKLLNIRNRLVDFIEVFDKSYNKIDDCHISLSKTFVLRYHMIKSFTSSLRETLSKIESFELNFDSVEVYRNEDKSRTFVALKVDSWSHRILWNLSLKIDNVLEEYKLPKFYEKPSYHVSILSVNGDKKDQISRILDKLNEVIFKGKEEEYAESVFIDKINCKSGNKYYQYCLD